MVAENKIADTKQTSLSPAQPFFDFGKRKSFFSTPAIQRKPMPVADIQRQDKKEEKKPEQKDALSGGLSVVVDNLSKNPKWEPFTKQLKLKLWENQPDEFKYSIIGFGVSNLAIMSSIFALDPIFRKETISTLENTNLLAPLALIPKSEYFLATSFKYKLPKAGDNKYEFDGEFDFAPYFKLFHNSFVAGISPKFSLSLQYDPQSRSLKASGGTFNIGFFGGSLSVSAGLNQPVLTLPPKYFSNDPTAQPVKLMNEIPSAGAPLPHDNHFMITVDLMKLFGPKEEKKKPQPKLEVNMPGDEYEQEADEMADKIMRTGDDNNNQFSAPSKNFLQRKGAHCEEEEKKKLQKKEASSQNNSAPASEENYIGSLNGRGENLSNINRSFFESKFGYDFSNVKIHTNSKANESAEKLNALAYTHDNNIVFASHQYQPDTATGKHLLAHELTHVVQQSGKITRKIPKDLFGRPLGFRPTPEQEAYDRETYEINQWKQTLERLDKGELDDRDLKNDDLRNRLTGLTTTGINTLVTKITEYQKKNPALSFDHLLEYLEVRKEISTPMPEGSVVSRDPITSTIDSYSLVINGVLIKVTSDSFGNSQNETGPTSNFGKRYKWETDAHGKIIKLFNMDSGSDIPVNPTQLEITIHTSYKDNPNDPSAYGKGTTEYDKEEKTTTLRVHEGKHGTDYINYIRDNKLPVDLSKGVINNLTITDLKKVFRYIKAITKESCEITDQVGFTQDEFLKTPEGKKSGITSCRK